MTAATTIEDIRADFDLLEDWEDRYRYLIELGRALPQMPDALKSESNKVRGCASQVWLARRVVAGDGGRPVIEYQGDSDAHIVRGLVALLLTLYSGRTAEDILATDAHAVLAGFGLKDHLSPQRSNGLNSMVERIRADARAALEGQ